MINALTYALNAYATTAPQAHLLLFIHKSSSTGGASPLPILLPFIIVVGGVQRRRRPAAASTTACHPIRLHYIRSIRFFDGPWRITKCEATEEAVAVAANTPVIGAGGTAAAATMAFYVPIPLEKQRERKKTVCDTDHSPRGAEATEPLQNRIRRPPATTTAAGGGFMVFTVSSFSSSMPQSSSMPCGTWSPVSSTSLSGASTISAMRPAAIIGRTGASSVRWACWKVAWKCL